jgi:thioredoxin-related protein
MKRLICGALVGMLWGQVMAAEAVWLNDLPKAQAEAKTEKKIVLMDFTGSDWCPACIALRKKVLDSKEFQEYATKNVVLMEVDFPQDHKQSDALRKANDNLLQKYNVDAYPTLIILDSNGKEIGRQVGYDGGSPATVIATLQKYQDEK